MTTAPFDAAFDAAFEADRVAELHALTDPARLGSVRIEQLVDRAAELAGVPMATLNLIDAQQQRSAATAGFSGTTTVRDEAMCSVTLQLGTMVVVADARCDARFRDSPWVDGRLAEVRFYASAPLTTRRGQVIGTLCVFDVEPHHLSAQQVARLAALAAQVVQALEEQAAAEPA